MSDYHFKDLADEILKDFTIYAQELCEKNQKETGLYEFTSQQMLKKAVHKNQDAYVRWLERSRERFPNYIFNKPHEDLGRMILTYANRAGFEKFEDGMTETDIFDNPTKRVVYRPKA